MNITLPDGFNSFLKKLRLENVTDLVEAMGGILGHEGNKFLNLEVLPESSDEIQKTFKLTTDFYTATRTFSLDEDEVIKNVFLKKHCSEPCIQLSLLHNQIEFASKAGFKQLLCNTNKSENDCGYYTCLMMGYVPTMYNGFIERFEEMIINTKFKDCESYLELLVTNEGRNFWMKNGFGFEGVFDVDVESFSMLIFDKYCESRHIQIPNKIVEDVSSYSYSMPGKICQP